MTIKIFETFAGIGTQRMALKNLGIDFEVIGISEIDKFAIKSYEAIHGETKNYGDIKNIDAETLPDFDLFTYSFPCQDISLAGKMKGFDKNSETRSSLLWECEKIIKRKNPKYLLMENVKNLVSKKFKPHFEDWLKILEDLGYKNYWQVLNAKDYGVPQNRERVFCISILGGQSYKFPDPIPLTLRLKDLLENEVVEKYYLSQKQIDRITFTARTKDFTNPKCVQIGRYDTPIRKNSNRFRVYDKEFLSPALSTMQGGNLQPCILIKNGTKKGYLEAKNGDGIDLVYPQSKTRRGRVQKEMSQTINTHNDKGVVIGSTQKQAAINEDGICPTLTSAMGKGGGHVPMHNYYFRIRKLTPLECWRLMGCSDDDFYKAQSVNSNTQLYKQAGNAIVVNILEFIFKNLFREMFKKSN